MTFGDNVFTIYYSLKILDSAILSYKIVSGKKTQDLQFKSVLE